MNTLTLDQFKTENRKNTSDSRLTLDQFKSQNSSKSNEELEKLTGGILGACHVPPKTIKQEIGEALLWILNGGK